MRSLSTRSWHIAYLLVCWISILPVQSRAQGLDWRVGVAKSDITPTRPVRLSGYGNRTKPTMEVDDRLSVRVMALKYQQQPTSIIASIDAIGLSATLSDRILSRLSSQFGMSRSQVVLCATHSHTAPHLEDELVNLLSTPLAEEEHAQMLSYSASLVDAIVRTTGEAINGLEPASLEYATGQANFAINRRVLKDGVWSGFGVTPNGPVDRTVRVIRARSANDQTLAVVFQYACHCTSISPDVNRISADWAGIAASQIEHTLRSTSPNVVALPIIGCGADANPNPRNLYQNAKDHGAEMAMSVQAILHGQMRALPPLVSQTFEFVAIAPERPSRDRLNQMKDSNSIVERNFANTMLDTLKRKGRLPETYPAPIHFWNFGDSLAWVFLGGEVVVDYQMRLESELSQFNDVWVAAYTDDVFAYIASERLRNEGGYEVDASMLYYLQPGRWVSGTEDVIVTRVLEMSRQKRALDRPMSPNEGLKSIEMAKGWRIEQIACEPTVEDPVNVAFARDGSVWILEMGDYPLGGEKSGRVKKLIDSDGDGQFESSKIFLDQLSYPAGIYAWRDGIVVACAPEVFIAFDRNGDGVADERKTLIQGFPMANPQHRVHGFTYGLDHRLYFGTGSEIKELVETSTGTSLRASGSDLSLDVDAGRVYLETGSTQYIRGCDDWGNWFGNDNSHPIFHYAWDRNWSQYAKTSVRTQYQHLLQPPTAPPVFPVSRDSDRFNDLFAANRYTSACSSIFCSSPGADLETNSCALICEPVHNLVARVRVTPDGASFTASRLASDLQSEWLRSSDPWFRPVRVTNAPDGTIWVVDMYRRVIEHPEWIPDDWQRRIDLRAGQDKGRVYRAFHSNFKPEPMKDWTSASSEELISALSSPSVAIADIVRQQLIFHCLDRPESRETIAVQLRSRWKDQDSKCRLRVFATLVAANLSNAADWERALDDSDDRVVRWAIETMVRRKLMTPSLHNKLVQLANQEVARQSPSLALHLIVALLTSDRPAHDAVAKLLLIHAGDRWIDLTLKLLPDQGIDSVLETLLAKSNARVEPYINQLVSMASEGLQTRLREQIVKTNGNRPPWQFTLSRHLNALNNPSLALDSSAVAQLDQSAWNLLNDESASFDARKPALDWFVSQTKPQDVERLQQVSKLLATNSNELRQTLIAALLSFADSGFKALTQDWRKANQDTKSAIISACVTKNSNVHMLLREVEQRTIAIQDFQAAQIEALRTIQDSSVQERVARSFGPPPVSDRESIVRDNISRWPRATNLQRGEQLYKQHCAQCHEDKLDAGKIIAPAVGPNLQSLAGWKNDAWITAIFDPNRSVEAKFRRTMILTKEGQTLFGLKLRDTDAGIEFVNDQGQVFSLSIMSIEQMKESSKSLMPEGFEKQLSAEDAANIVTYLRSKPLPTSMR